MSSTVAAIAMLMVAALVLHRLGPVLSNQWVQVLCSPQLSGQTIALRIADALRQPSMHDQLQTGVLIPLVSIRRSDNRTITLAVIEGEFTDVGIDPVETWKRVERPAGLFNSVNEMESVAGGISGPIGRGCTLWPSMLTIPLHKGDIVYRPCTGPYNNVGITTVINAVVIVGDNAETREAACWNKVSESIDSYEKCIEGALFDAFGKTFATLREHKELHSIIVPALGTGNGRLAKEKFYMVLCERIMDHLTASNDNYLPSFIYLHVFRGDQGSTWGEARSGISQAVGNLADKWSKAEHKVDSADTLQMSGVLAGMAVLLFAATWTPRLHKLYPDINLLAGESLIANTLGWLVAALGAASALRPFVGAFTSPSLIAWITVVLGFAAVLLCGPLLRQLKRSKEHLEADKDELSSPPL